MSAGTYADQRAHDVAWMTAAEREAAGAGAHYVAPGDDGGPWDTCARCGKPVRDKAGAWVTMVGANAECYGGREWLRDL